MKNKAFYEHLVNFHNQEAGTSITLKEGSIHSILPRVDMTDQVIWFSERLETLLLLFNRFMHHKQTGSRAIHLFLLFHLAIRRNMYEKAEELLTLFHEEIKDWQETEEKLKSYRLLVSLQCSVILGHEMSHIYYAQHPDLLKNNIDEMRHRVRGYKEQFNTDKPLFIKLLHFFSEKIKNLQEQSYDEAIGDDFLLEELCCDESAWQMVGNIIKSMDLEADTTAEVCAYAGLSLSFMQSKRTLENIYLEPGQDIRERDLRFDTSRHTLYNIIVWDYIDEVGKKASKYFQSLINDYQRIGYAILMKDMHKEIDHIAYIRHAPEGKYSLKDVKRLEAMYKEIHLFI